MSQKAIERVTQHILRYPDNKLDLPALSDIAAYSPYHFHRLFRARMTISVQQYVQRVRIHHAAKKLSQQPQTPILDIALASGFQSAEHFARVFKQTCGVTASQFRQQPQWQTLPAIPIDTSPMEPAMTVDIVNFSPLSLALMDHKGPEHLLAKRIPALVEWRQQNGLGATASRTFTLYFTDPEQVPVEQNHLAVGVELHGHLPANNLALREMTIPSMRCARLRHVGHWNDLEKPARYLYGQWLTESGESAADFPFFVERVTLMHQAPPDKMITDLYLPLEAR